MLRYKTETRNGLVALYDIRSGNGAGQFLQPRNPHGACFMKLDPDQGPWTLLRALPPASRPPLEARCVVHPHF